MSEKRDESLLVLMTLAGASEVSEPIDVRKYDKVAIQIDGYGTASGTIKFKHNLEDEEKDFSAASPTADNPWALLALYDLAAPDPVIDGATGVVVAADGTTIVYLNTEDSAWIAADLTWVSGTFTVKARIATNQ